MTVKYKSKTNVTVDRKTFEALILCRNELAKVYIQFGGTATTKLSKALGAEVDWNGVNNYEIDNMDDDDDSTPQKKLPEKINIPQIARHIYNSTGDKCARLNVLRDQEIRNRIKCLFCEDIDNITTLASRSDYETVSQLANALGKELNINLGPTSNYVNWLGTATFGQFLAICREIKEIILDEEEATED